VLALLAGAGVAAAHVGVEAGWWPSPLPQCQAPRYSGGTLAQRLAQMPAHPSKACEDPTYLVPGVPVSMAQMNLLFALALAAGLATFGWRSRRSEP
jgi:disulfide bond formation protein DsbB